MARSIQKILPLALGFFVHQWATCGLAAEPPPSPLPRTLVRLGKGSSFPEALYKGERSVAVLLPSRHILVVGDAGPLQLVPLPAGAVGLQAIATDEAGRLRAFADQSSVYRVNGGLASRLVALESEKELGLSDTEEGLGAAVAMTWLPGLAGTPGCLLLGTAKGLYESGCFNGRSEELTAIPSLKTDSPDRPTVDLRRIAGVQRYPKTVVVATHEFLLEVSSDQLGAGGDASQVRSRIVFSPDSCPKAKDAGSIAYFSRLREGYLIVSTSRKSGKSSLIWKPHGNKECRVADLESAPSGLLETPNGAFVLSASRVLKISNAGDTSELDASLLAPLPGSSSGSEQPGCAEGRTISQCVGSLVDLSRDGSRVVVTTQTGLHSYDAETGKYEGLLRVFPSSRRSSDAAGRTERRLLVLYKAQVIGREVLLSTDEGAILDSSTIGGRLVPEQGFKILRRLIVTFGTDIRLSPGLVLKGDLIPGFDLIAEPAELQSCPNDSQYDECVIKSGQAVARLDAPVASYRLLARDEFGGEFETETLWIVSAEFLLLLLALPWLLVRVVAPWLSFLFRRTTHMISNEELSSYFQWVFSSLFLFPALLTAVIVFRSRWQLGDFSRWLARLKRGERLEIRPEALRILSETRDLRSCGERLSELKVEVGTRAAEALVLSLGSAAARRFPALGLVVVASGCCSFSLSEALEKALTSHADIKNRELQHHAIRFCRFTVFTTNCKSEDLTKELLAIRRDYRGARGVHVVNILSASES